MARPSLLRRFVLPPVLFLVLAAATACLALALQPSGARPAGPPASSVIGGIARTSTPSATTLKQANRGAAEAPDDGDARRAGQWSAAVRSSDTEATHVRPSLSRGATVRPDLETTAHASTDGAGTSASYHGRNHVWIPALGIDRSVSAFPCSRTRPPDNLVYRWGCAGKNNVYLLGHAHSVFGPLHEAYIRGTLRKGMEVVYADGQGRVRTFAVTWWRITRPTTDAKWAWAAQSRPSMTLQTCVGSDSEYRLIVRLVARD
jgi:hypothetical protein